MDFFMQDVLLHCCCAPCSSAIIEWMLNNEIKPTLFYFNPNIYPDTEYLIRKNELKRYAQALQLRVIDGDYDHSGWREAVKGHEMEPERGATPAAAIVPNAIVAASNRLRPPRMRRII